MIFCDHSSSMLLPHVYLYVFLHFIMHSRAPSLSLDLLFLYIYFKLLVFSLLFLTHGTHSLSFDASKNTLLQLFHSTIFSIHKLFGRSMCIELEATVRTELGRKNFMSAPDFTSLLVDFTPYTER